MLSVINDDSGDRGSGSPVTNDNSGDRKTFLVIKDNSAERVFREPHPGDRSHSQCTHKSLASFLGLEWCL